MKTRQLVFNDPKLSSYVKKHFVSVAASDVEYNNLPNSAKAMGEYQFLKTALTGAPHGIHQGIYVVTASAKYLKKANVGWPSPDSKKALEILRDAVAEYQAMPKSARLAKVPLTKNDRSIGEHHDILPEPTWLKIRSTTRSFPFEGMDLFDLRHPVYYKLDRLWLTPESARGLVPEKLQIGQKSQLGEQALHHLIYDGHLMLGCPPWWHETVKKAEMSVRVVAQQGRQFELKYRGSFELDSDTKYNRSSYRGSLLGTAVWDDDQKRFTRLKWVTLGQRNRRVLKPNETESKLHHTTVGAVLELDPMRPNDRGLAPHRWQDGYPKSMLQEVKSH